MPQFNPVLWLMTELMLHLRNVLDLPTLFGKMYYFNLDNAAIL